MSFGSSEPSGGKMSFSPNDSGGKMSFSPNDPPGGKMSFSPEPAGAPTGGKMSFSPEPAGGKMSFSPNEPSGKMSFGPSEGSGGKMSFGPSEPSGGKMSFGPSEPSGGRFDGGPSKTAESTGKLSFGPNDPPTGGDSRGVNPFGQMPGCSGTAGSIRKMGGMGPMGMGMGLDSEFMFRAALQQGMVAASNSTLHLLLPSSLLQKTLIPKGYLADIAKKCQVQIDLGSTDVAPDLRQVTLKGGLAANAMAAYFLQDGFQREGRAPYADSRMLTPVYSIL
eukprot:g18625.t1